jgi:alcohol dehydrogenase, propanol-preferring
VNRIPIPKVSKPTEILVKIASASLCHSDIMLVTKGHEGDGYVEHVGAGVNGFKKGDHVGFLYITGCCY